jgi:hypothetical protein
MNNSSFSSDKMDVDEIKLNTSEKKNPLARASLELCPIKFEDDKTENQYSLNVELDDADYLNQDPLEHVVEDGFNRDYKVIEEGSPL